MKIKIDYVFPEQYRIIAEEYISYKRSMGFSFGYDDQKKCDQLLHYLYDNSISNDVTDLTKKLVEGYLAQFHASKPRTIHANQSYIRQYGLFLKQMGYKFPGKRSDRPALHPMEIHRNNKNEVRPLLFFPRSIHFHNY